MVTSQTQSSTLNDTTFHFFPRLPTEIRLEIWRASLPSRIIPIDSRRPCPGPSDDRISIWQRPPSIAHVCQEARGVAFGHGHLRWAENATGPVNRWAKTWIDPSRDLIFIDTVTDLPKAIPKDILDDHLLADAKQAKAVVISWDYINFQHIEHTAHLMDYLHSPFLYIAHKCIVHLSQQEAIDSGLFGCNAEETAVLVDYKDKDRLLAFLGVCELTNEGLFVLKELINSLDDPSESQVGILSMHRKISFERGFDFKDTGFLRLHRPKTILLMRACTTNSATSIMTIL